MTQRECVYLFILNHTKGKKLNGPCWPTVIYSCNLFSVPLFNSYNPYGLGGDGGGAGGERLIIHTRYL